LTGLRATAVDDGAGAAAAAPTRGASIDRYLVLEPLGRGGMGVVVSAYDPALDRKVAVKLIAHRAAGDSSAGQARLVREAKAMARLSHPNVVPVYDAGTHAGDVFVAMELCEGGTLRQHLRGADRPWSAIVAAFVAAGRGLAAAHAAGIIHRDFKPRTTLDRAGVPRSRLRLAAPPRSAPTASAAPATAAAAPAAACADRQAGRAVDRLTMTGAMVGTPAYMAPEQFRGKVTRADQFALAVMTWEALYGERPFAGRTRALEPQRQGRRQRAGRRCRRPQWPRAAARAREPAARYPTVPAFQAALNRAVSARRRQVATGPAPR
jgi:serine/threonine protein kinase